MMRAVVVGKVSEFVRRAETNESSGSEDSAGMDSINNKLRQPQDGDG